MIKVAVYGSLRKGFQNHHFLDGQQFLGTETVPNYKMYNLGTYPGIVPYPGKGVFAEVYDVTPERLKALDGLEGHPTFYCRKKIKTEYGNTWIYELANPDDYIGAPTVSTGEWGK